MISSGRVEVDPAALHARQAHRINPSLTVSAMPPSDRPIRPAEYLPGWIPHRHAANRSVRYASHERTIRIRPVRLGWKEAASFFNGSS